MRISTKHFIDSRPNLYLLRSFSSVNWSRSISCCRNFFFTYLCQRKVRHFVCFYKLFPTISELIDLLSGLNLTRSFFPRLVLIVLSGTESNRGIKYISRLARFNLFNNGVGYIQTDHQVSWKLPTHPSPEPTLTITFHLRQNDGLGEG